MDHLTFEGKGGRIGLIVQDFFFALASGAGNFLELCMHFFMAICTA